MHMWPNAAWQDFSGEFHGPEDSFKKVSTLFQTANRFARRALGWNTAPRPVSASWPGIAMVAKNVANVTASLKVWEEAARNYSFIGGGLGYAGRVNDGKFFLEMCRFGSHSSDACCNKNADPSFQNLAGAAGWKQHPHPHPAAHTSRCSRGAGPRGMRRPACDAPPAPVGSPPARFILLSYHT